MSSTHRPLVPGMLVAAVLLAGCGGDPEAPVTSPTPRAPATEAASPAASPPPDPSPTPEETPEETEAGVVVTLTVSGGDVSGADDRVTVPVGQEVTLRVTADVDDEIHVHGYDLHEDVTAGEEAALTFTADIPGVFEVELEDSGVLLVRLEVR